ncbi:hypothetical protein J4E91_010463 [Alternaria rosae]|nr:hypothetical protein J4E91_010463 [Alternaria rosae]
MTGGQSTKKPTAELVASEISNIDRFAEHVNERKRRRNLWGQYADEQSRKKSEGTKPVHTPVLCEASKSKGTQTDDTLYVKEPDVDESTNVDDKDVKAKIVKSKKKDMEVDKDGSVRTACVGGLPTEQDNMNLYEP